MTKPASVLITTPIYYVNAMPHLGHAYTTIVTDAYSRFRRLCGDEVRFQTGTDEHGEKVQKAAGLAGMTPQQFTDRVSQNFRDLARAMNFSNDDFIRTTEPRHAAACSALWQRLAERGHIYLGSYAGWYAIRDEAFYAESELTPGPDGSRLAPTGAPVAWVEEPSYFFRLSSWQEPLLAFYEAYPDFIAPESRRNEVISFVRGGLQDLSVSRTTFDWGIPVPGDPAHIMYVWFDALTNYLTAAGYPDADYGHWWPADLHMVGKDILRFHAVYWPAMLMAADIPPPRRVFAHGWWTNEGQKISKSLGNVIDPHALVERYGVDQVRYFMLREVPFGADGDFSHRAMVGRINGDLANDFGNLAQRVLSLIARNCAGRVPSPAALAPEDEALLGEGEALLENVRIHLDHQQYHLALVEIWQVVSAANGYIDRQAPWALKRTDPARMQTVLWVLAETLRRLALLSQPFIPEAAARLLEQLAVDPSARSFAASSPLVAGTPLPPPKALFPRHTDEVEAAATPEKGGEGRARVGR